MEKIKTLSLTASECKELYRLVCGDCSPALKGKFRDGMEVPETVRTRLPGVKPPPHP